jgi:hypothetical protein
MEESVELWKQEKDCSANDEKVPKDSEILMVKNKLVDMMDKFDFLLYTLMTQGKLMLTNKKHAASM